MRACIIGAGSCGIASAKVLADHDIAFDWFEMSSGIGGNWRYENENGRSAAYASLHIDTSKHRMAFSDLPMADRYPVYPHSHVLEYFEQYVSEFDLFDRVQFGVEVRSVVPIPGQRTSCWEVTTRSSDSGDRQVRRYEAVLVANGHHWSPRLPSIPGTWTGTRLHSQQYRTPEIFVNKKVVILGVGNSGSDIACEAASVADEVYLASRRGAHVIPRFVFGRPTDTFTSEADVTIPFTVRRRVNQLLLWLARGPQRWYGFPVPDTPVMAEHPTLSQQLLPLVKAGMIKPKPSIARCEGRTVVFADDSLVEADIIVFATGYRVAFPFLDTSIIDPVDNEVRLYRNVVAPHQPGLFFVGLLQPLGAIMPLAELQAKWIAELLTGGLLPPVELMERRIDADWAAVRRRYVSSPRHTLQVDFYPYKNQIEREIVAAASLRSPIETMLSS